MLHVDPESIHVSMTKYRTLQKLDTIFHADSVEFCPCKPYTDVLLCGTYQLQDQKSEMESKTEVIPQNRLGRLLMYQLIENPSLSSLQEADHLDMAGILDIKWFRKLINTDMYFGIVNSIGHLMVYSVVKSEETYQIKHRGQCILGDDVIGLSLDTSQIVPHRIVTSDSAGKLSICNFTNSTVEVLKSWKAHDFEAWITAQDQHDINLIFSGGDDCKLKVWDERTELQAPVFTSKKHSMGVTSMQSHPINEHIFASGSYDENLFIWDKRSMKQPLSECNLGGGIWRIKWNTAGCLLLTATMHNGFHIVEYNHKNNSQEVKMHYTEHDSLAYGVDWCYSLEKTDTAAAHLTQNIIASCSFYDHSLQLWEWNSDVT